jgi:hypothetical protein
MQRVVFILLTLVIFIYAPQLALANHQNAAPSAGTMSLHLSADAKPIFGNASLVVKKGDIPTLRTKALDGSADAASRLSRYYGFVTLDHKAERYWAQIAAENGDPEAMYNYAIILTEYNRAEDNRRALFWMKKAAGKGYKAAIDYIKENPGT